MGRVAIQILWQIDNVNCFKWTFLYADTTTNTQLLRKKIKINKNTHVSSTQCKLTSQRMHNNTCSEIKAILLAGVTSIQSLPKEIMIIIIKKKSLQN
jgi:hypothetical protein